jgi:2-iminobutanoate/2-iminopropanoate deaminase
VNKDVIGTDQAPAAVGPYSQGVQGGGLLFTAGQLGLVPGTKEFAGSDIESQTRQALTNLEAVLEAGGSCLKHVLKTTVFLADMDEFPRMNAIYAEFFPQDPPARSAVSRSRQSPWPVPATETMGKAIAGASPGSTLAAASSRNRAGQDAVRVL